ncbi:MAG: DUF1566 domain-containing protein [Chloroflexi bacterium]|nr:DUF1566 domain-containing protein [Chloroflexota bacterium]
MRLREKAAWGLAAALGLFVVASAAGVVSGGPMDPPGSPGSTYKSLAMIPGSWLGVLPADDTGDPCNSARFACVMGGAAVLDNETGLVWQRDVSTATGHTTSAVVACATAGTGGRNGWRLPDLAELSSLLDPAWPDDWRPPAGSPFTGLPADGDNTSYSYWTSNQHVEIGNTSGWAVEIGEQGSLPFSTSANALLRHWCVRGAGASFNSQ